MAYLGRAELETMAVHYTQNIVNCIPSAYTRDRDSHLWIFQLARHR